MDDDDDQLQDFRDAIDIVETASKTPARSRTTKIGPTVDEICEYAYQFGIQQADLMRLVELVTTKTELDQSSVTTIIKNLYPSSPINNDAVVLVVNCLGQATRKPSASTQAALVRWLAATHDVLEDQVVLSRLYAVLFNLLDMISIRTPLCHLLSLITRRKHVRPFRIQRLLELSQQAANEPALVNLLRVYKNFCPEIVVGSTSSKPPRSSLPDPEWRQRLQVIQQLAASMNGMGVNLGGFRLARNRNGRESVIPEVHTFRASDGKKTLEEVQNAQEFVENLGNIEAPAQIVAALQDPLLQKHLQLGGSEDAERRLEFWLTRYFEDELETVNEGFGLSPELSQLLNAVSSFTDSSKTLSPVVERFLRVYLPLWNGQSDLGPLTDLASYLPPQPFKVLHSQLLSRLEQSVISGAEAPFDALFEFYSNLAHRWMISNPLYTGQTPKGFLKSSALFDLVQHVSTVASSALASGQPAHAATLAFYERLADSITHQISNGKQIISPILPPQPLFYLLASSPSLSILSRTCALVATYKRCFETQVPGVARNHQANGTELLNGYLMDLCNMLWRSRALNASDSGAAGFLCPEEVTSSLNTYLSSVERDYSIHTIFDLSHNPSLAALSQSTFSALEAKESSGDDMPLHAGPVTQRSLMVLQKEGGANVSWKQYRLEVLQWMEGRGLDGVRRLMFATMKDLMK